MRIPTSLLLLAAALVPTGAALGLSQHPVPGQDLIVKSGTTYVYDTSAGRAQVRRLVVEPNALLLVRGPKPFLLEATHSVTLAGRLVLSGVSSVGVTSLNTGNQPELGAAGHAGGGRGGTGSQLVTQSTPAGGDGFGTLNAVGLGGGGGESGFGIGSVANRRAAGGGGGALGPNQPVHPDPLDPSNLGLIAQPGQPGSATATGAISQVGPPAAGTAGGTPFVDGDPTNDFWGEKMDPVAGLIAGELKAPLAGTGGGAGGDAVPSATFPNLPWNPASDEKGAGGGGGGGLGLVLTRTFVMLPGGSLEADGGSGGGGENTFLVDRVGGGSGGGSGGMLALEAALFDLRAADADAITALGGRGGPGANDVFGATGAGGNGGPGLIQLHTPGGSAARVLLPMGKTLADLTSPDAHVLLPKLGL